MSSDSAKQFKSFVTEAEIEEQKKKRQEEWEKVRKPEDPLEAPEEEYDPRSLYERLQEQKDKRQADYEENHKLKNLIRGLDDDEIAFLELVDKTKIEIEEKRCKEDQKEIQEYRKAVAHLSEAEAETKLQELRKNLNQQSTCGSKKSQHSLLAGALKRKQSDSSTSQEKKRSRESDDAEEQNQAENENGVALSQNGKSDTISSFLSSPAVGLQCLGVLPGLGAYSDSSDSENSSNSETEKDNDFDLIGRRRMTMATLKDQIRKLMKMGFRRSKRPRRKKMKLF